MNEVKKNEEETTDIAQILLKTAQTLAIELNPRHEFIGPVTLDYSLDNDLGLDSLGRVELLVRLEKAFHVTIPEQVLGSAETLRDLLRAVLESSGRKTALITHEIETLSIGETEDIPDQAKTLVEVLHWHVASHPDRPHIRLFSDEDEGEIITYQNLLDGAESIASGLLEKGLEFRDPVILMLPTGREYFYSFMGILLAGGIPVPIYPPARLSQIEEHLRRQASIINNCQAKIIITVPEAVQFAKVLQFKAPSLKHLVTHKQIAKTPAEEQELPIISGGDTALLQYTSGSTGDPKGVILTHDNLLSNIRAMGKTLDASSKDVFISWLPLYHDMGLIGAWLGSMYYAAHLIIMSPLAFITRPQRWLWAIHRFRGTLTACPNFAYELCLKRLTDEDLKGLDLSSLRKTLNGAEAVSPHTVERFSERFAQYGLAKNAMMPVYGLAECSVGLTFPPLDRSPLIDRVQRKPLMEKGIAIAASEEDKDPLRFVACGRPLPDHQVRIVDTADRELPELHEGYLQFCGPSVTSGYLRSPEKTRDLFHGKWLDSSDMAYIKGGDVFITGRRKDIIIRAGRHIYPEELEEEIGDIKGIRKGRVAAFGSLDQTLGTERLVVLAETRETDSEKKEKLRTTINETVKLLAGDPPDDIVLASPDTVLKTSSGKIRRSASRALYEEGKTGRQMRFVWGQMLSMKAVSMVAPLRNGLRNITSILYAAWAWFLAGLIAIPLWIIIVSLPFEKWRWKLAAPALDLTRRAEGIGLTISGKENLPPPNKPFIVVSNHQSYLDGFIVTITLKRMLSFVAKAELRDNFFTRLLLSRLGTVFVERFDTLKSIEDSRQFENGIKAGKPLMFFSEGTFTRAPGLRPFKIGAFEIAAAEKLPIVPIAIRGTRSILRGSNWFPRRGNITVVIGSPIDTRNIVLDEKNDTFAAAITLRNRTREWILNHCGEPDLQT